MISAGHSWRRAKEVASTHSAATVASIPCPFLLLRGFCKDFDLETKHRHRLLKNKEDEVRKEAMNTLSKGLEMDIVDIRREIAAAESAAFSASRAKAVERLSDNKERTAAAGQTIQAPNPDAEESLYSQFVSLVEELKRERKEYKDYNVEAALTAFFEKSKVKRCRHTHSAEYIRMGKEMSPYALLQQYKPSSAEDTRKKGATPLGCTEFFEGIIDIGSKEKKQVGAIQVSPAGWMKAALEILLYNGASIKSDSAECDIPFPLTVFDAALDARKNTAACGGGAKHRRMRLTVPNVIIQQSVETTSISKPAKPLDDGEEDDTEELRQLHRHTEVEVPALLTLANTCLVSTRVLNVMFPVALAGGAQQALTNRGVPDSANFATPTSVAQQQQQVVTPVRVTHHVVDVHLQLGHLPALVDFVAKSIAVGKAVEKAYAVSQQADEASPAAPIRVPTQGSSHAIAYNNQVNLADPFFINLLLQVVEKVAVSRYKYELQPTLHYDDSNLDKRLAEKHVYTVRYRSLGIQNCNVVDPEPLLSILQKRFRDEDAAYHRHHYSAFFGTFNPDDSTSGRCLRSGGGYRLAVASMSAVLPRTTLPHPSLVASPSFHNVLHALDISNNKLDSLRFLFFIRLHFLPRVTLNGGSNSSNQGSPMAANSSPNGNDATCEEGGGSLAYLWINPNPITLRPDYRTHVLNTLHKGMGSSALHQVASDGHGGDAAGSDHYRLLPLVALDGEPIEKKRLTLPFPVAGGGSSWNERGFVSQQAKDFFPSISNSASEATDEKQHTAPFSSPNEFDRALRSYILFGNAKNGGDVSAVKSSAVEGEGEGEESPEEKEARRKTEEGWKNYYARHPMVKQQADIVKNTVNQLLEADQYKGMAGVRPCDLLTPSSERAPLTDSTLSTSETAAAMNFLRMYQCCWESGRVPLDVDADLCTWAGFSLPQQEAASGANHKSLLRQATNTRVQHLIDAAESCQDVRAQLAVNVAKIIASGLSTLRCKTISRLYKLQEKKRQNPPQKNPSTKLADEDEGEDDDDYYLDTLDVGGLGAVSVELLEDKDYRSLVQALTVIKYKQKTQRMDDEEAEDLGEKEKTRIQEECRKEAEAAIQAIQLTSFSESSDVDQPMADPALGTTSARGGFNVTPAHAAAMLSSGGAGHTTINAFLQKFPLHHLSAGVSSVPVTSNTPAISRFLHPNCTLTLNALAGCSWYDALTIRDTVTQEESLMAGRGDGNVASTPVLAFPAVVSTRAEDAADAAAKSYLPPPVPHLPTVPFACLPKSHAEATLVNIGQLLQEEKVLYHQRMRQRREAIRASKALAEERARRRQRHLMGGMNLPDDEEEPAVELEDEEEERDLVPQEEENYGNLNNTNYDSEFYAEYAVTKDVEDNMSKSLTHKDNRKKSINGTVAALQRRAAEGGEAAVTQEDIMLAVLQQLTQHSSETSLLGTTAGSEGGLAYAVYARTLPPFLHFHLFWYLSASDIRQLRLLHAAIVTTYSRNLLQLTPAFMLGNTAAEVANLLKAEKKGQPKLSNTFDRKAAKKRMLKEDAAKKKIEDAAYKKSQRKLAKKNKNKGLRAPVSYEDVDAEEEDSDSSGYEEIAPKKGGKSKKGDNEGSDSDDVSSSASSESAKSLDDSTKKMLDARRQMLDKLGQRANWEENLNSSVAKNENIVSNRVFRGGRDCCDAFRSTLYPAGIEVSHFFATSEGAGSGNAFHPNNQQGSISIHAVPDFKPTVKLTGVVPSTTVSGGGGSSSGGGSAPPVLSKRQQQIEEMKAKIAAAKAAKDGKAAAKAAKAAAQVAKAGMVVTATGGGSAFFGQGVTGHARPTYFAVTMHGSMTWTPPSSKSGEYSYRCKTTMQTSASSPGTAEESEVTNATTVNAHVTLTTPVKSVYAHVDRTMTLVQAPPTVALSPYYITTSTQRAQLKRKLPVQYLQDYVADRSITMCKAVVASRANAVDVESDASFLEAFGTKRMMAWYAQERDVALLPPLVRAVVLRHLDRLLMGAAETGIVDLRSGECGEEVSDLVALVDHFLAQRGSNALESASKASSQEKRWSSLLVIQAAVRAFKTEQQRRERITSVREALDEEEDALEIQREERADRLRAKRIARLAAEAAAEPEPAQGRWPRKKKAPHPLAADFDEEEEEALQEAEVADAAPRAGERRHQQNDRLYKAKTAKLPTSEEVAQKAHEAMESVRRAKEEAEMTRLGRKRIRQGRMGPAPQHLLADEDADRASSTRGGRRVEQHASEGNAASGRRDNSSAHALLRAYNESSAPAIYYLRRFQIVNDAVTLRPAPSVAPGAGVVASAVERPTEANGFRAKIAFASSNNRMFNSHKAAQEVMSNSHALQLYHHRSNANASGGSVYCHLSQAVVQRLVKEYTFLSAHNSGLGAVSDDELFSGALYFPPPAKTIQQQIEDAKELEEMQQRTNADNAGLAKQQNHAKAAGSINGDGGVRAAGITKTLSHEEQCKLITRSLERALSEHELHEGLQRDILGH